MLDKYVYFMKFDEYSTSTLQKYSEQKNFRLIVTVVNVH
jgi:hypothetical protein